MNSTRTILAALCLVLGLTGPARAQRPDTPEPNHSVDVGDARVHFAGPDGESIILEIGGDRFLIDASRREVVPVAAFEPVASNAAPPVVPVNPTPEPVAQAAIPVDEGAREGAVFGSRVVNLANGKGIPDGGVEFLVGHRFSRPLFESDSPKDLFGFDSRALVTFGGGYGFTDWLGASVMRSSDKTIALESQFQISDQGDSAPVSTQLRLGVDGDDNFTEQYSPYLQFVAAHTFADRLTFVLSPGVAFNTQDARFGVAPDLQDHADHDFTASFGVGASLRLLPTVSVVGEYVPRVAGFRGHFIDRPSVSFGVQKSTFRHTFELVISNTFPMTMSGYTVSGTDTFKIGFNIYRRLR